MCPPVGVVNLVHDGVLWLYAVQLVAAESTCVELRGKLEAAETAASLAVAAATPSPEQSEECKVESEVVGGATSTSTTTDVVTSACAALQALLDAEKSRSAGLEAQVSTVQAAVAAAKKEAGAAREETADVRVSLVQSQALVRLLETQTETLKEQLEDANTALNSSRASLETTRCDRDRELQARKELEAQASEAEARAAALQQSLRKAKTEASKAAFNLDVVQEDLDSSQMATEALKVCLADTTSELESARASHAEEMRGVQTEVSLWLLEKVALQRRRVVDSFLSCPRSCCGCFPR